MLGSLFVARRLVAPLLIATRTEGADLCVKRGASARAPAVSLTHYLDLWASALAQPRPLSPLVVADSLAPDGFAALCIACTVSQTVGDSIEQHFRHLHLGSSAFRWQRQSRTGSVSLWLEHAGSASRGREASIELLLAECVLAARVIAAPGLSPIEVRLPHEPRAEAGDYERFFDCPVVWRAERAELITSPMALAQPTSVGCATMRLNLERAVACESAGLPHTLRQHLQASMLVGPPSVERAARSLAISARTLRRQLRDQGTSFNALLEETRANRARAYLSDSRLSLTDIAFLLGYASLPPLLRAIKRWQSAAQTQA